MSSILALVVPARRVRRPRRGLRRRRPARVAGDGPDRATTSSSGPRSRTSPAGSTARSAGSSSGSTRSAATSCRPTTIADNLAAASEAVARYAEEAAALHGPVPADEVRAALLAELDRAGRALEMVGHGCDLLQVGRGGGPRELEAQTAIKRGYLNVLHAREAIARHADDLASGRPADQRRWLTPPLAPDGTARPTAPRTTRI